MLDKDSSNSIQRKLENAIGSFRSQGDTETITTHR